MDRNQQKGRLAYSVGETLLSAWEASRLGPGDIVLTSREAGYPGFLLFNNLPLGIGEVVILDGNFGVRVVDSDFRPPFPVDPGRVDELGEMVPCIVELGAVEASLDQIRGLGRHSFLNLGIPSGTPADAVLMYAGFPLVRGKVVVAGELMGLRVTERLADLPVPGQVRQSGNVADRVTAARVKDYNFAMPDRWSHNQIRRLAAIHSLVQRNLEGCFPGLHRVLDGWNDGMVVDQCTLGEARELLGKAGLGNFWTWEHEGARRLRPEGGTASPRVRLFEADGCPRPLAPAARKFIDDLFTSQGLLGHRPVFLHPGPGLTAADADTVADCVRNGWKNLLDFRLERPGTQAPAPVLSDYEMVILVTLGRAGEPTPVLALVYPFLTLEPYLQVLGA